jgi:hypothetical protein
MYFKAGKIPCKAKRKFRQLVECALEGSDEQRDFNAQTIDLESQFAVFQLGAKPCRQPGLDGQHQAAKVQTKQFHDE